MQGNPQHQHANFQHLKGQNFEEDDDFEDGDGEEGEEEFDEYEEYEKQPVEEAEPMASKKGDGSRSIRTRSHK
jgi:hypothetical protein